MTIELFLCPLARVVAGSVFTPKGKALASASEVAQWYERELATLRKKVERRLARLSTAIARGESGFHAQDAWPEL